MHLFLSKIKNSIRLFKWSSDRTINSIKVTIACFIALCLIELPGSLLNQWTLLSIVVVMSQANLGGILKKSYDRIIGTLIGALVAGISILLFEHDRLILDGILLLSCLIFSYCTGGAGGNKQMGVLGSVTVIVILLANPPVENIIFLRPIEIIIGVLIALLVTHFVFPIRATVRLKMSLGDGLEQLKKLLELEVDVAGKKSPEAIKKIEEELLSVFIMQRDLVKDSKSERHSRIKKSALYELMVYERNLHRAILLIAYTAQDNSAAAEMIDRLPVYAKLKQEICAQLNFFATILKAQSIKEVMPKTEFIDLTELIEVLRALSTAEPQFETRVHIDAFIVSIRFFVGELAKLSKKIQEMNV